MRLVTSVLLLLLLWSVVLQQTVALSLVKRILRRSSRKEQSILISGYVPDGLTAQEYGKIKQKEAQEQARMNYGAWGPRFATTGRPNDMLITPSELWTQGYVIMERGETSSQQQRPPRMTAFILSLAVSNLVRLAAIALWMRLRTSTSMSVVSKTTLRGATVAVQLVVAILFTARVQNMMEYTNRRWLWSTRRTALTASAVIATLTAVLLLQVSKAIVLL